MRLAFAAVVLAAALAALPPAPAAAQVTTVDRGTLVISRGGAVVGREDFEIRSQPGVAGAGFEARGTATIGGRTITSALTTTPTGTPLSYRVEVREGGTVAERVTGQAAAGRLRVDVQSAGGRSAREFAAGDGTIVLDDEVLHHYFFAARRQQGAATTAVVPRRSAQRPAAVSGGGAAQVTIGGRAVPASRLGVADGATVLVDREGRLLQVTAGDLVGTRSEPPR